MRLVVAEEDDAGKVEIVKDVDELMLVVVVTPLLHPF